MKKSSQGFTLVELLVASTIFIFVMVISIGAVLTMVDANRKAQSLNSVMTNLNFALDSMSREIREGKGYTGSGGNKDITFTDNNGRTVKYYLSSDGKSLLKDVTANSSTVTSTVTGKDVTIDPDVARGLDIEINGTNPNDQPNVFIHIQGTAGVNTKTSTKFNIQTFLTQTLPNT